MDPVMTATLNMLGSNDALLDKALRDLTDDEAWKHPGDGNPIYWIAGHIAVYRHSLAAMLGAGAELAWAPVFKRMSQPDPSVPGPALSEIRAAIQAASATLAVRLAGLTDAELSQPAPVKVPAKDPTLRGMIAFLAYHETYHLGQLAYICKWLGHPGLVDGQ
jgi:uncharacterized damage-inducible protein DinB